jgi:hypothetical protein
LYSLCNNEIEYVEIVGLGVPELVYAVNVESAVKLNNANI